MNFRKTRDSGSGIKITSNLNFCNTIIVEGLGADDNSTYEAEKPKVDSVSYVNYCSSEEKVFSYLESKGYTSPLISHFANCEKRNEA